MDYNLLQVIREGHVATVTLNRPEKLNALSVALMEEIEHVAGTFREDAETRVVIFTGAGKHFTAGADLSDPEREKRMKATLTERRRALGIGPRMTRALLEIDPITIAAVNRPSNRPESPSRRKCCLIVQIDTISSPTPERAHAPYARRSAHSDEAASVESEMWSEGHRL